MPIGIRRWRCALAAVALAAVACGADASPGEVSPEQVLASRGSDAAPLLLDVRTPEEFAQGHVPGAILVPVDQLAARTGELDAQREIVVYCESGRRARKAADTLAAAGFGDVKLLTGQMKGWRKAGLPTE